MTAPVPDADVELRTGSADGDVRRRQLLWAGSALAGLVLVAVVVWVNGAVPAELDGLDPETVAFVMHHDDVSSTLTERRAQVAARAEEDPAPERLLELTTALEAAHDGYDTEQSPPWLADEVASYLDALMAERDATAAGYAALRGDDDAREALREVLDERADAENLQRAIRRTATARDTVR